jgi:hypothetical protein
MVTATDVALGRQALEIATNALPEVEVLVGAFPYTFLYIIVTDELPEIYAGVSYDEFIALALDAVDGPTIVHEIGHSTLYGIFPTWFEEGFAHFLEYYLTSSLEEGVAYFSEELVYLEREPYLDLRPRNIYAFEDYVAERAQGFLFLEGVYEIRGIEGMASVVRSFRSQTFNDQDLLRAIVEQGGSDERRALRQLVCDQVLGARRNYCVE